MTTQKLTILGCGTSAGVPPIAGYWGQCDPSNPKNRRRRVSIAVEQGDTRVIVDTSPDLRDQCLDNKITKVDAVVYTHDHADHTHGIDDLRLLSYAMRKRIDVYGDQRTMDSLTHRFNYIFHSQDGYPAICNPHVLRGNLRVGELDIRPFEQIHGNIKTLGFRFDNIAYSTDVNQLEDSAFEALEGVRVWVVDCLRREPHPSHSHLEQTLDWIDRVKPDLAILTHMTWDLDYDTLMSELPDAIVPAYDGMVVEV